MRTRLLTIGLAAAAASELAQPVRLSYDEAEPEPAPETDRAGPIDARDVPALTAKDEAKIAAAEAKRARRAARRLAVQR